MTRYKGPSKIEQAEELFKLRKNCVRLTNDVAIATVFAVVEGELVEATGVAKRHPDDRANPRVASLVANARAVENLAIKIERRAQGAIKHADDMAKLHDQAPLPKTKSR